MKDKIILLVEDNPDDEALTLRALQKNNIRNEVVIARDGAEALDYLFGLRAHEGRDTSVLPQLVLLDLKLPKMDGLEVLRSIRRDERTKRLPVVILTSSKEERDLLDGYELGANSYVRKPVDFTAFAEAVRQLGLYWLVLNESHPSHGGRNADNQSTGSLAVPDDVALRKPLRVLHIEDSEDDSALVMRELRRGGFDPSCKRVDTQATFKDALRDKDWDVIISDYSLPCYNGMAALADAREGGKDIPFIVVSGTIGENVAVDAMRAGAEDYVLKGNLGRLPFAVEREVREAAGRATQRKMSEQLAISERMASAGTLAAGVAHEINNPLAVVMVNLDFVTGLLGQLPPDRRLAEIDAPLQDAREAVDRIRAIVRDVKLFSRAHDEERSAVDVESVMESSIRMAWNEIRHRAQLIKEYGKVPRADSNEARLGQILLNLLVNAAQAIPEGRASQNEIHVVTATESGRVVIEVRDTGTGIPREILARIFDPFFTTKAIGVGTGLGLSLCHRMVTDLGGEIAVESEVGKGSCFRVILPAATGGSRAAVKVPLMDTPKRRAQVLVVDDEVAIGRALERSLGRYHDVVVLTSGKEALARIAAGERFDAILSDLMMPEVTGMEIYERLSRTAPEQAKRMIFLTGGTFTDRARTFLDQVPNVRVEKPFEATNILEILAGVPPRVP